MLPMLPATHTLEKDSAHWVRNKRKAGFAWMPILGSSQGVIVGVVGLDAIVSWAVFVPDLTKSLADGDFYCLSVIPSNSLSSPIKPSWIMDILLIPKPKTNEEFST